MKSVRDFTQRHPQLAAFLGLAVAMVAILIYAAKDVPLLSTQWATLVMATIGLAGLCIWIIGWE